MFHHAQQQRMLYDLKKSGGLQIIIAYSKLCHNELQKILCIISVLFIYYLTSLANIHIINVTTTRKIRENAVANQLCFIHHLIWNNRFNLFILRASNEQFNVWFKYQVALTFPVSGAATRLRRMNYTLFGPFSFQYARMALSDDSFKHDLSIRHANKRGQGVMVSTSDPRIPSIHPFLFSNFTHYVIVSFWAIFKRHSF